MAIYNLVVLLYGLAIKLASISNVKASQWVKGRKDWKKNLAEKCESLGKERIWVHCASYGEFEQGKPLMEAIRQKYPNKVIVLSFFSPSGYESFKEWKGADLVLYLPLDTPSNAKKFLNLLQPEAAIFIKYEFWLNYLNELRRKKIKAYLVSATFKPHHPFFKSYGSIFRNSLNVFDTMFLQDAQSAKLLESIGFKNVEVSGDTRFDRVIEIRYKAPGVDGISEFKAQNRLLVAGSTWPKDEELLVQAFQQLKNKALKMILAPHHVDAATIKQSKQLLERSGLSYCQFTGGINNNADVLLLDTIGVLSRIYRYGNCAYVGGGFNEGIHNTLEPAVYGIPVAFYGPEYTRHNEAVSLVEKGCAVEIKSADHFIGVVAGWLDQQEKQNEIRNCLNTYFAQNSRVTERILEKITL